MHSAKQAWCEYYTQLLRDIAAAKIDFLTAQFLSRADEYEDHETKVMNRSHNTEDIAWGVWVHTSAKQGRIKKIEFPKIGFNIELPVALQKSRTSIRVVRTLFDHVSGKSELSGAGPLVPPGEQPDKNKRATTPNGSPITGPPPLNFVSVGGIINIEQLALPPAPKKAKGWVMRDITPLSRTIQIAPYPATSTEGMEGGTAAALPLAGGLNPNAAGTSQAPLRVTFTLPGHLYLDSALEPHFGWWDGRNGCWRQEGVTLTKWEPKDNTVNLSLTLLKPVAVIQPRALDYPYRDWSLIPSPESSTTSILTLLGSRFSVVVELVDGHCRLLAPTSPVLTDFNTTLLLPGVLFSRMARSGINVQPTLADAQYCRKPIKDISLTAALHEHIALAGQVFDVAACNFNSSRGPLSCMFRVRLNQQSQVLLESTEKKDRLAAIAKAEAEERARQEELAGIVKPVPVAVEQPEDDDMDEELVAMQRQMQSQTSSAPQVSEEDRLEAERRAEEERLAVEERARLAAEQAELDKQERHRRGMQWHTIMVQRAPLDQIPGLPVPDLALPPGTIPEDVPGGNELLKFVVVKGEDEEGQLSLEPMEGCVSHLSLRRCLLAYFKDLTPHDLATALNMGMPEPEPVVEVPIAAPAATPGAPAASPSSGAVGGAESAPAVVAPPPPPVEPFFLPFDQHSLKAQQTIRRTLNLVNVFTFH